MVFDAGHSYDITIDNRTVASALGMNVDASQLAATDSLTFDASAETDSPLRFKGGQGDDDIRGGAIAGTFDLSQGGNDTATGGAGNDLFTMGAALNAGDMLRGGGGNDRVVLNGNYTNANALTLTAGTLQHIATFEMTGGNDYHVTVAGSIGGFTVLMNPTVNTIFFNASGDHDTSGQYVFNGATTGDYILTGGAGNDIFNLQNAAQYTARGGHGVDFFNVGTNFTASDFIDGGGDFDTVEFSGGSIVIGASNIFNVEDYRIDNVIGGFAYHFTITDADIPPGGQLFIDGDGLDGGNSLDVDASAVTAGSVVVSGGAANDTLVGGAGDDTLEMGNGQANTATGGGGADFIRWGGGTGVGIAIYNAVSDSTGVNHDSYDTLFTFGTDHIEIHALGALPTAIDARIATGALSTATFDSDLAAAVGAGQLGAGHAVLFRADSGDLHGHTILVVDENGTAGYQAGQDLVIDVSHDHGTLTTATFI
jgi:Ca2+-binding RTX toxin-like protein